MTPRITITAIAGAIDLRTGEFSAYLNRETGEIEQVTAGLLSAAGDNDDQQELVETYGVDEQEIAIARQILNDNGQWLPLPSRYDVNEYRIIQQFCYGQTDPDLRDRLLSAIKGKGAFRRFKDTAERTEVLEQ
jgi:hypothetical protein